MHEHLHILNNNKKSLLFEKRLLLNEDTVLGRKNKEMGGISP